MFDTDLTKHLAELSKLTFSEEEFLKLTAQMSDIIDLMDMVKDIDPKLKTFSLSSVSYDDLRVDEARDSFVTEDIIKNARAVKDNAFVVPKVV